MACPSRDTPASCTLVTPLTVFSRAGSAATALMSACVSGPLDRAATSGIGTSAAVPNGAASCAACELGALAGRNLVLLFWVTLFSEGSSDAAAIAPATHVISTSQRNLTAREPIVLKMVSICTDGSLRGEPDKTLLGGCLRQHRAERTGPARGGQLIWPSHRGARTGHVESLLP